MEKNSNKNQIQKSFAIKNMKKFLFFQKKCSIWTTAPAVCKFVSQTFLYGNKKLLKKKKKSDRANDPVEWCAQA